MFQNLGYIIIDLNHWRYLFVHSSCTVSCIPLRNSIQPSVILLRSIVPIFLIYLLVLDGKSILQSFPAFFHCPCNPLQHKCRLSRCCIICLSTILTYKFRTMVLECRGGAAVWFSLFEPKVSGSKLGVARSVFWSNGRRTNCYVNLFVYFYF